MSHYRSLARLLGLTMVLVAPTHAQSLPNLREAFGSGTPGAGAVARGNGLSRVNVPIERYPEAMCADGSEAVVYVRAASRVENRDDWIVYLQGGGSCESGADCHARWLGQDGNFGANKLSSRYAPAGGIKGEGIESTDPRNPFGTWNHAFIYYCSSDGWSGQAANVATSAEHEGARVDYRIHFLGARIVDAVFDLLRGGNGPLNYTAANGTRTPLRDLDQARRVLFAGSSAGGGGVRSNVDRIGELLRQNNLSCSNDACPLVYAAVIDTSYSLSHERLDHSGSRACGVELSETCSYELSMRPRWFDVLLNFRQGVTDASCVTFHAPRGDEWRCADGNHLLEHHIRTPFFARVDLQDRLAMGNALESGFNYQGVALDRAMYGALEEIQLRELATLAERSEEPRQPSVLEPPGVFAPQCGDHETLRTDGPTFGSAVAGVDGKLYTTLEVLANWLRGAKPSVVIEHFDLANPPATCRVR